MWPCWLGAWGWSLGNTVISIPSYLWKLAWLPHLLAEWPSLCSLIGLLLKPISTFLHFLVIVTVELSISLSKGLLLITREYWICDCGYSSDSNGFAFPMTQKAEQQPLNTFLALWCPLLLSLTKTTDAKLIRVLMDNGQGLVVHLVSEYFSN